MKISLAKSQGDVVHFHTAQANSLTKLGELVTAVPYSLSTFKDGYRNKANFISAEALGIDFDEGFTLAEAEEAFRDYRHIIAPTRSHQKEKNGVVQDRFRVILFLSSPISDAATFESTWFSLAEKWPALDRACKDPSRFFYPSQFVHSIQETGMMVDPVPPKPKVKSDPVDLSTLLPGDRGKLSKETLNLLIDGKEQGGRNHAVYKAAKDFQQNLYTLDETLATIIASLEQNGTIDVDFDENEVTSTIQSAFSSDPKHEPRIRQRAFKLSPIGELYKDESEIEWLVEDLLMKGGLSLLSADPKAGKSVIARQLARDVLRGTPFFGRTTKPGSVFYFGMEEHPQVLSKSFKRLGITEQDSLMVHVGDALNDEAFEDFREIIVDQKPALAIVDTVFDVVEVENENAYGEVKKKLRKLRQIARDSGTHILAIHHNAKSGEQNGRRGNQRILGSQAISGAMDTIMVIGLDGRTRKISSSGREVMQWNDRELIWDSKLCTYSLGPDTEDPFL